MIEALVHIGHQAPWTYTPRNMKAWLVLARRRERRERRQDLQVLYAAVHGEAGKLDQRLGVDDEDDDL